MDVHIVSSLAPDEESRLAARVLAAIGSLFDETAVSYSVRIETALGNAIHFNHTAPGRNGRKRTQAAADGAISAG